MAHDVLFAESVLGDVLNAVQDAQRFDKSGFRGLREVYLRDVAGYYHLAVETQSGQEHFHLLPGGVLGFVEDNKAVVEGASAHVREWRDFDYAAFLELRERFLPDDAEIDAEIKAAFPPAERVSVRVRAERAASKLRTEKHASKYFFAGMGLYALSFFSAYRFYMRLTASAMMFAAMLLFIRKITASSKPADSRR